MEFQDVQRRLIPDRGSDKSGDCYVTIQVLYSGRQSTSWKSMKCYFQKKTRCTVRAVRMFRLRAEPRMMCCHRSCMQQPQGLFFFLAFSIFVAVGVLLLGSVAPYRPAKSFGVTLTAERRRNGEKTAAGKECLRCDDWAQLILVSTLCRIFFSFLHSGSLLSD